MKKIDNIPKVIHYFWFGGNPLPLLAKKCIDSWKQYFPEYEIIEWNESNFDVNIIPYTAQANTAKKYAFVSDYARLWVLYKYGGIYFDTDVEVIKPFDDILKYGAFIGLESCEDGKYAPALGLGFACPPGLEVYQELLESYENDDFITASGKQNLSTIVIRTANILKKYGFVEKDEIQSIKNIIIYPTEYFCPKDFASGRLTITRKTHSIHWYDASWQPKSSRIFYSTLRHLPFPIRSCLKSFLKFLKGNNR